MKRIALFLFTAFCIAGYCMAIPANLDIDSIKREAVKSSKEIQKLNKDSVILSKLNPEQLMKIKQEEIEMEKQRIDNEGRNNMPFTNLTLTIIIALPFIFILLIFILNLWNKNKESKRKYDLYMKSLEMGQNVPDHFFEVPEKKQDPASNLKKGLLWLGLGLGVSLSFLIVNKTEPLFLGIIPAFVGLAYLLVYFLENKKKDSADTSDEQLG